MEPADLNPASRDDERLETLLRRSAPQLMDNGFSSRVLAALPAAQTTRSVEPQRMRFLLCAAAAVLGVVVAVLGYLYLPGTQMAVSDSFASALHSANALRDPSLVLALSVTATCLLYVFRPWSRLRT